MLVTSSNHEIMLSVSQTRSSLVSSIMHSSLPRQVLKDVHNHFLESGADVIGTLSYKLSEELLEELTSRGLFNDPSAYGLTRHEVEQGSPQTLFHRSVQTAIQAKHEFVKRNLDRALAPLVFASVGPCLDSTRPFSGSSDPNTRARGLEFSDEFLYGYYRKKLESVVSAGKGGLAGIAVETLAGLREARVAARALQDLMLEEGVFLELGCATLCFLSEQRLDSHLLAGGAPGGQAKLEVQTATGESLSETIGTLLTEFPLVFSGVGINCINPKLAFESIRECIKGRSVACENLGLDTLDVQVCIYPNSGENWDSREGKREWLSPHACSPVIGSDENLLASLSTKQECGSCSATEDGIKYLTGEDALAYKAAGAEVIGGCCRVDAKQIAMFRRALVG